MEQLFTDRKFHFCYHRNFRVFFVNGKRPEFVSGPILAVAVRENVWEPLKLRLSIHRFWHWSCRSYLCCFLLALANIRPWPFVPFFQLSLTETLNTKLPTIPKGIVGCVWVHCSLKKFKRMTGEVMDLCLRVLKESSKSRFDSYSVRNSVLTISHNTLRDCRVHIFSDILSRNSCMLLHHWTSLQPTATLMLLTERGKASELGFYNDCTTFSLSFSSE